MPNPMMAVQGTPMGAMSDAFTSFPPLAPFTSEYWREVGRRGPQLSWNKLIRGPSLTKVKVHLGNAFRHRVGLSECPVQVQELVIPVCPARDIQCFWKAGAGRWSRGNAEEAGCAHCSTTRCFWQFSTVSLRGCPRAWSCSWHKSTGL